MELLKKINKSKRKQKKKNKQHMQQTENKQHDGKCKSEYTNCINVNSLNNPLKGRDCQIG